MFDLPLEYALIAFENAEPTGKIVPELLDLAQRGIVRFVDIVFIHKEEDGAIRTVELNDLDDKTYEMFVPMGEHVSSLFTNDDLEIAAAQAAQQVGGHAHPVGEPVGRQLPPGCGGRWRRPGGARPDRTRNRRGVRASNERGIARPSRSVVGAGHLKLRKERKLPSA